MQPIPNGQPGDGKTVDGAGLPAKRKSAGIIIGVGCALAGLCGVMAYFLDEPQEQSGVRCAGYDMGCTELIGRFIADPTKAPGIASTLEHECQTNDDACVTLAVFLIDGAGVDGEPERAVKLLTDHCDDESPAACTNLGVVYATGKGVARDERRAVELYQRACDLGDLQRGCYNLGGMYDNGIGVTKNPEKAAQLNQRACEAGEPRGCLNLGNHRLDQGDERGAAPLYIQACDSSIAAGCYNLALLVERGGAKATDVGTPAALRRRACELGLERACTP